MVTPENQQAIINFICELLQNKDPRIRAKAAESLGKLGVESAIPSLRQAVIADPDIQVRLNAINALLFIAKPELLMTESAKNQPTFQIGQVGNINTGDVTIQGDQVGIQHNYASDAEVKAAIVELQTLLTDLQTQHPTVTSETQALEIIDAEFTEIKRDPNHKLVTLRQQILNPERHLQAIKATAVEVTKHYLEESVWAKATITYIDKLSETPDQGV